MTDSALTGRRLALLGTILLVCHNAPPKSKGQVGFAPSSVRVTDDKRNQNVPLVHLIALFGTGGCREASDHSRINPGKRRSRGFVPACEQGSGIASSSKLLSDSRGRQITTGIDRSTMTFANIDMVNCVAFRGFCRC